MVGKIKHPHTGTCTGIDTDTERSQYLDALSIAQIGTDMYRYKMATNWRH